MKHPRGALRADEGGGSEFLAKYHPDAFPKEPLTGKTPFRGKISPPCIRNELVLARYAPHVFKMPCKAPFGNTSRGYLAIKAPFCRPNPSNHAWRATLAMHDGFHRTNLATLDGSSWTNPAMLGRSSWTNPAMLDGFSGRILSRSMVSVVQVLPSRPGGSRWANPVGQSTLDEANGFHLRVRHCHFRECPLGKST